MKADSILRWVVVPSWLLFGGWKLFLLSEKWSEARLPVAVLILIGLVVTWTYACVVRGLEGLQPGTIFLAGLGALGPVLRASLEGLTAIRESLLAYPTQTAIDITLTLLLALVTAPICFILYRRKLNDSITLRGRGGPWAR